MEPTRDVESSRLASDSELALLEASTAKRAVRRQRVKEEFAPQAELPHSANPDKHEMPEYMFYGIGVMHYELVEYAWRKRLFSPEGSIVEPGLVTAMTVAAACLEELQQTTRFRKLIIRWPQSPKYDWVIALYSNYHLSPKLEDKIVKRGGSKELLRKIVDELGLKVTASNPRTGEWHFDPNDKPDKRPMCSGSRLVDFTTGKC